VSAVERVFVSFRWGRAFESDHASALIEATIAAGGRIAAWLPPVAVAVFDGCAAREIIDVAAVQAEDFPCAVGIAAGAAASVSQFARDVELMFGSGIERAVALTKMAEPGEVLLDGELDWLRGGELLTRGSRRGHVAGSRLRARVLDLDCPWRDVRDLGLSQLKDPEWTGPSVAQLPIVPGALAIVRASRGSGGTRALKEIAGDRRGAAVLWVRPGPVGEPLGALRHAFLKALATELVPPSLTGEHGALLETLLAGEGLDHDSGTTLIGAWLGAEAPSVSPLIVVDDADAVDSDSIEVIAATCLMLRLAVVVRTTDPLDVPPALRELPLSGELRIDPLTPPRAADLVGTFLRASGRDEAFARFGRRGSFSVVAVWQALLHAVERGEIVRRGQSFHLRGRVQGRGRSQSAERWILRRMRSLDSGDRRLLEALATLGGEAEQPELDALAECMGAPPLAKASAKLVASAWLERVGVRIAAIPSMSQRDTVLGALPEVEQRQCFAHAAAMLEKNGAAAPMSLTRAVVYRYLAGDVAGAREISRRAAGSARAAGLSQTAAALEAFAQTGERDALEERGLLAPTVVEIDDPDLITPQPPEAAVADPEMDDLIRHFELDDAGVDAARILACWQDRDFAAIERYAGDLPATLGDGVPDRLIAMTYLMRGKLGPALQLLRKSKLDTAGLDPTRRSRAALALAIGLAAAGRSTEALLEVLDGLARAREAEDARSERACSRFLAELSRSVGAEYAAARWALLAAG
jgi:hypothetical protein